MATEYRGIVLVRCDAGDQGAARDAVAAAIRAGLTDGETRADPEDLSQVIVEIIINAADASIAQRRAGDLVEQALRAAHLSPEAAAITEIDVTASS